MITVIVALIIIGLVLWLINSLPLDPLIQKIIYVVAIIGTLLWLLQHFGLLHGNYLK